MNVDSAGRRRLRTARIVRSCSLCLRGQTTLANAIRYKETGPTGLLEYQP